MSNECSNAFLITTIACQIMNCMDPDEVAILSADLIQLADTLDAMLTRQEICGKETCKSTS